jgi:hypothetical protein
MPPLHAPDSYYAHCAPHLLHAPSQSELLGPDPSLRSSSARTSTAPRRLTLGVARVLLAPCACTPHACVFCMRNASFHHRPPPMAARKPRILRKARAHLQRRPWRRTRCPQPQCHLVLYYTTTECASGTPTKTGGGRVLQIQIGVVVARSGVDLLGV